MAALVQTYAQQTNPVTMLQTRPSSASGMLQNPSQGQSHHQFHTTSPQMHRNSFHGLNNITNYRGHTAVTPVAAYNFTAGPQLALPGQRLQGPHLRLDQRTSSAPVVPNSHSGEAHPVNRSRYPAAPSVSTTSSSSSDLSSNRSGAKEDSSVPGNRLSHGPNATIFSSGPRSNSAAPSASSPVKATPDRYRRPNNRRSESAASLHTSSGQTSPTVSNMPNVMQFYGSSAQPSTFVPQFQEFGSQNMSLDKSFTTPVGTADDMQVHRNATQEQAQRYRRRSIHTIDATDYAHNGAGSHLGQLQGSRQLSSANGRIDHQQQHPLRSSPVTTTIRPITAHGRNDSSDSVNSARSHRSRPSSATQREAGGSMIANPTPSSTSSTAVTNASTDPTSVRSDQPRLVNIPPRASSTDAAKRIANPSPLSKPVTMNSESSTSKDSFASAVNAALQQPSNPATTPVAEVKKVSSPAAQQLAALSDKDAKKSKTSRLRRAFSFGSAQELRRASAGNSVANATLADRTRPRTDLNAEEHDAEQARIAAQQEAGGIGSGIYSGQGNYFGGSTDNISISSTASSASIMIRKMGKGMKKSTRSLVGLFRPKSVIGVPAADSPLPQGSQAQVSMVTVEAEREKVNVNANPHDQSGGGTGFPRLENNSLDASHAERLGSSGTDNSGARRSIVGGDKERAEVLAAVKKGILKRTDSANSSPVLRPLDGKNYQLPQIPNMSNSPLSSAPSTPTDESRHKKNGSVTLGGEDYFMSALRFQGDSKSVPTTPQGSVAKRNATFSPRIQFHDTWPSGEYDRRGEIATCNRLTPMLAQQIKEELNTFKMEMEVHENSKIYTHFF